MTLGMVSTSTGTISTTSDGDVIDVTDLADLADVRTAGPRVDLPGDRTGLSLVVDLTSGGSDPEAASDPLAWQARALCAQTDPEAFFPEKGGSAREAKRTCLSCEVRVECLDYALMNDERFGIWGGLSERERRRVSRAAV